MDERGEIRRAMDKHVYWSQLDPSNHHFYKIMKYFRFELRLPKKFVMKFPVKLGNTVKLSGPIRDVVREVRVVETEEDVVLREGWGEFVDDHHINEEDLLVFHYVGDKTFEVFLFDRTACEKDLRFIDDELEIRPHFFKMMNMDFKSKLLIPRKLVTKFPEKLVGKIKLRGPSGNVWEVRADWSDSEDVFLGKGWSEFVSDHSLDVFDLLVFRYTGDSSFNVLVFDKTGCEKESAHFVKPKSKGEQTCDPPGGSSKKSKGKKVTGAHYEGDFDEPETQCKVNTKKMKCEKNGIDAKEIRHRHRHRHRRRRLPKEVTLAQLNELKIKLNQKTARNKNG